MPTFLNVRGRFSRLAILSLIVLSSIPLPAVAAEQGTVARGDFIRNAIKVLDIPVEQDSSAPTERVPAALVPYIATAHKRGALKIFGTAIDHAKAITRGEAMVVLMKLQNLRPGKMTKTFTDAPKGSDLASALQVAIDNQWMRPQRPRLFGVNKALTTREMTLLMKRLKRKVPARTTSEEEGQTPIIRVQFRPIDVALPKDEILEAIWRLLNDEYLYKDKINGEEAAYKAAEGLVQSLGDPYTVFFRPAKNKNFQNQIQGEVTGIGAQVEQKNGVLVIVAPLKDSPAERAGLLAGDEILESDGVSLAGLSFQDAVDKVRGPKGSSVKLKIRRAGSELEVTVVRDTVKVPEIDISFQGAVAVVKLHQFGQITDRDLRTFMLEVQKQNPSGIVLDLRNNPGGLLHAATIVLSNFLSEGTVVATINSSTENKIEVTADPPTVNVNVPMVVLVNKGSASASEIVAGALQDHKRARIVGETTFGKGTVQQVLQFNDGSSLKMTVAEWHTPLERKIDGVGIEPDIKVEGSQGDRDEQMLRALELLR
ncbi:S41 family peptidase [Candidatus Peregrinibacteria bacterium]|nr:S41 family peptidase [Candidatus Peregrinibacteria bacterium]